VPLVLQYCCCATIFPLVSTEVHVLHFLQEDAHVITNTIAPEIKILLFIIPEF
jgi:hypothetical protein